MSRPPEPLETQDAPRPETTALIPKAMPRKPTRRRRGRPKNRAYSGKYEVLGDVELPDAGSAVRGCEPKP